ncbi:MAG: hypothetical protein WC846_04890 [Candidatus Gracilibacteria bacterium]|jgi:hypothetical protein
MKKLLFLVGLLVLTSCGNQPVQSCIDSCKDTLSMVCTEDQTQACTAICAEDEEIRNCMMDINVCEDLDEKAMLCFSRPEPMETLASPSALTSIPVCESVCDKYSVCAGFGDDVTEADQVDAYDSCMIECPSWSSEGLACMDELEIKEPIDCMQLSVCGTQEYDEYL